MSPSRLMMLFKFLAAGLPAFILAIPLNFILVETLEWSKSLAYALVLVVQVTINFFMCRKFVFDCRATEGIFQQFILFFSGILIFRVADWVLYSVLVEVFNLYFIAVQVFNVFAFSLAKFTFSSKVLK